MKDAFLVTELQCLGCKLKAELTPATIVKDKVDAQKVGSIIHKNSKVVCIKPMLVILYQPVLISNELVITPPVEQGSAPNGNGNIDGNIILKGHG